MYGDIYPRNSTMLFICKVEMISASVLSNIRCFTANKIDSVKLNSIRISNPVLSSSMSVNF